MTGPRYPKSGTDSRHSQPYTESSHQSNESIFGEAEDMFALGLPTLHASQRSDMPQAPPKHSFRGNPASAGHPRASFPTEKEAIYVNFRRRER